ncbi:MAG TPA: hypothetical protein VLF71_03465 [Candidatus Saccharimonadales bacterium]|nr:hypothetical protein [Candidatus Saccharimonadales bacterium]
MSPDVLASIVRKTYFSRFSELELDYKLHFASRLYTWGGDAEAAQKLAELRPVVLPATHAARLANLQGMAAELGHKNFVRDINNYATRKPYFEKYPQLLLLHNMLFRIRRWECIYGVDERASLFQIIPEQEIRALLRALARDAEAITILSTYAVNAFYMYENLYAQAGDIIDLQYLFNLKDHYGTSPKDLQLLLYLYTHCIIGETLFYFSPVRRHADVYHAMLVDAEQIIASQYQFITLDNKCEFLVCARVCGYTSALAAKIYDEAGHSLNKENFLVDTINKVINPMKQSLLMSEHCNALFIMSTSAPRFQVTPIGSGRRAS